MKKFETITKVAEDIYRILLPLPFALNHVYTYLLRGASGWTIIDTGIHTEISKTTWKQVFQDLQINLNDIEKIVLTHIHPDHFGLSGWLQSLADSPPPIFISKREHEFFRLIWLQESKVNFPDFLRKGGLPDEMIDPVSAGMSVTRQMTYPHPTNFQFIDSSQTIQMGEREFQIFDAPGHSDGQLIFYDADDRLMICGDHVLMTITPNIGVWTESGPNPLGQYMQSLQGFRDMDVRLGLSGHRQMIHDWQGRIDELIHHHDERLALTMDGVGDGQKTGYEIARHLFSTNKFAPHEWRFAMAESLAHLEYLRAVGKLQREGDNVIRYSSV